METFKIHFRYIVGILVGLLILTATFRWTELKDFTTYLSNAATFTSLALALVAIIISVVAGNTVSRDIGSVSQATSEVRHSVSQVSSLLSSATQVSEDARRSNTELSGLIGTLRGEFSTLRTTSETLAANTVALKGQVEAIPTVVKGLEVKMDETQTLLKASVTERASPEPSKQKGLSTPNDAAAKSFMERASLGGLALLYACSLGIRYKKNVEWSQLAGYAVSAIGSYQQGYAVAASAANFIQVKDWDDLEKDLKIVEMHSYLLDHIHEYLLHDVQSERLKSNKTEYLAAIEKMALDYAKVEEKKA